MKRNTNWLNLLRLNLNVPVFDGEGTIEASTLHIAKTNETIIADWQTFSNIEAENNVAAIAVLGYMHEWQAAHLFVGVRNVNEDFFTSDITTLFINSSCGIFPTIAASYPIANYPFSGLTVYFDVSRGGWTQDHLRLVGVCRAARVVGCRPLRDVYGAVLGEHLSPKCLLQVCRGGLRLLRQSQPVRTVCSMRSLPSRHRALR